MGDLNSNLMPVAATVVVLLYAGGVIFSGSAAWYHWIFAAAGVGFAIWYWYGEAKRIRERRSRDKRP